MTSLRRLLLVAILGGMFVIMTVATYLSYRVGLQEAGEMFDAKLAHSARVLMSLVDESLGDSAIRGDTNPLVVPVWHGEASGVGDDLVFPLGHAYETKLAFQALDANGRLLMRSDSGPQQRLAPLEPGFADVDIAGERWRTFTLHAAAGRWYQTGERDDIRSELAEEIASGTLLPLLIALPVMSGLVWLVVSWASRGLLRVSSEIGERTPDNLEPIHLAAIPSEIQGLVKAVNGLLERLGETLVRERRFTDDAAHELRTPIAALKVHADNVRAARDEAEREESMHQLTASVDRIERLVAQLLAMSRIEFGPELGGRGRVDLRAVSARQIDEHRLLLSSRRIAVELDAEPAVVQADEASIEVLVRNLVDNAIRYTPAGGSVRITVKVDGRGATWCIEDSGPGIPAPARERVFERFHRELGHDAQGSGLGLSIVRQVLLHHHGDIVLDDSPDLGGLRVTVRLLSASQSRPAMTV